MITYPQYATIRDSVRDLDARAGRTNEGVAKILQDFEVTGLVRSVGFCAVAEWLRRTVPAFAEGSIEGLAVEPATGPWGAVTWTEYDQPSPEANVCHVDCGTSLPAAVNDFAVRFDEGDYPELVRLAGEL